LGTLDEYRALGIRPGRAHGAANRASLGSSGVSLHFQIVIWGCNQAGWYYFREREMPFGNRERVVLEPEVVVATNQGHSVEQRDPDRVAAPMQAGA